LFLHPDAAEHIMLIDSNSTAVHKGFANILESTASAVLFGGIEDLGFQALNHNLLTWSRPAEEFELFEYSDFFRKLFQTNISPKEKAHGYASEDRCGRGRLYVAPFDTKLRPRCMNT
jgi:hypothetical protein